MNQENLISTKQAADLLGYDESHVRRLLIAGKLKGFKVGHVWVLERTVIEKTKSNKS